MSPRAQLVYWRLHGSQRYSVCRRGVRGRALPRETRCVLPDIRYTATILRDPRPMRRCEHYRVPF